MLRSQSRHTFVKYASACCLLMGAVGLISGCGGDKGPPVTGSTYGTVTNNGTPVKAGQVVFVNVDPKVPKPNTLTMGFQDGKYALGALATGTYKVYLLNPVDNEGKPKPADDIPEKYRSAETSDITTVIKSGGNEFNIELK